jgi:hypothetical protein
MVCEKQLQLDEKYRNAFYATVDANGKAEELERTRRSEQASIHRHRADKRLCLQRERGNTLTAHRVAHGC